MMSKRRIGSARFLLAMGTALFALAVSYAAEASDAYVTGPSPLLSGPAPDYPPVLNFNGGEPVTVYGCLQDYGWCDVSFEDYRGWLDGNMLAYGYQGQWVPLYDYGYEIGVPVIGFSFYDYWGRYYRDRPFYRDQERWARIPPPSPRPHDERPRFEGRHFEGPGFRGPGFEGPHFENRPGFGPERRPEDYRGPEQRPESERRPESDRGPDPRQSRPEAQIRPEAQRPPQPQPQGQRPPQQPRPQPPQSQPQRPQPQAQQPHPQQQQPAASKPQPHPEAPRPEEGQR